MSYEILDNLKDTLAASVGVRGGGGPKPHPASVSPPGIGSSLRCEEQTRLRVPWRRDSAVLTSKLARVTVDIGDAAREGRGKIQALRVLPGVVDGPQSRERKRMLPTDQSPESLKMEMNI